MALHRKIAYIDLTKGEVNITTIPIDIRKKYIGGRGLNNYLLYNHLKEKVEPLSPDNVVVIGAGLLGGTLASASGWTHLASKSPLTSYLGSTNMGGFFAPELRWAGFDHLVIKGKALRPSYLFVHNGKIDMQEGASIWGKTVQDTQEILRQEIGDERVQILCIGPAGERLVRFANVMTRHMDAGARTGIGAVLGSKNLKAIVARGTMGIELKFPKEAIEYERQVVRNICSTEYGKMMKRWGTTFLQRFTNDMGLTRTHNFQYNKLTDGEGIEADKIAEYAFGMDACFGCQLHCRHRYIIDEEPYQGVYAQGPCYESQGAWGAEVGCRKVNTVLTGNYLANSYGLDILETGSLIAWAMELYEKRILSDEDTDGLSLDFGNDEAVIEMIHRIGKRDGLGDILAEGGIRAAQKIGKDSKKYLVHVKGVSCLPSDERPTPGMALGTATANSGPELLHSRPIIDLLQLPESTLRNIYDRPYSYDGPISSDFQAYDGKPWQVFWHELCYMASDMIGMCKYHTVFLSPNMPAFEEFSKMIYYNTGIEISAEEIWQCANRAYTLERLFNLREGATRNDDWLPDRYFNEPTTLGTTDVRGKVLNREKFKIMIDEYYRIHGWSSDGVPKPEILKELGLDKASICRP